MSDPLTIGMATRGEFDSVWFTLTALTANHPRVRYLVVDNTPQRDPRTEAITRASGGTYLHRPDLSGTSPPRDAVFRFADTPWVMCIDSHVILETGAVQAALDYCEAHPDSRDLVQGPMVHDDGQGYSTHWRQDAPPGLWGTWDRDPRAESGPPFEIPMMGLGLWMMRQDAWPGFHPLFRGFGGEEGYIHEVVRRRVGRALCLPALRWRHKFRDVSGWDKNPHPPYPLRLEDHVWNLLVGHRELGIEALPPIHEHFGRRLPPQAWESLVAASEKAQPFGGPRPELKRQKILAVWYSDNSIRPRGDQHRDVNLLELSAASVMSAAAQTQRHDVTVSACSWSQVAAFGNRGTAYAGEKRRGYDTIVNQIRQAVAEATKNGGEFDAVCFCEHDVLYPANYFDRVGDALALNPAAPVVSNLDYIGLSDTGWQRVREWHEPLHQLTLRWEVFQRNLARAEEEAKTGKPVLLEPQEYQPHGAGLHGYDMDHTINGTGLAPLPGRPFVVITGRPLCDGEHRRTLAELKRDGIHEPAEVCLRDTAKYGDSDEGIAGHKAEQITRLGVREFWEDNPRQVELIRRACPGVTVHQVRGGGFDARSNWVRLAPSSGDVPMPAVHVNHKQGRFTSHGEVCYEPVGYSLWHPHWGEAKDWWPGQMTAEPNSDPKAFKQETGMGCSACEADKHGSLDKWLAAAAAHPSDFHEHVPTLKELAARCGHATEISAWQKPADVALAAGLGEQGRFTSVCRRAKPQWKHLAKYLGERFKGVEAEGAAVELEPTDLLFVDTEHDAEILFAILERHHAKVNKYIVVHCTETFGETGDQRDAAGNAKPGVLQGLGQFLSRHMEWGVIRRDTNNHGLMVLSKLEEDRKALPGFFKQAANYLAAVTKHAAAGQPVVSQRVFELRMAECAVCPERSFNKCSACGCPLEAKLQWGRESCGLVKKGLEPKWGPVTDPADL